MTGPLYDEIWHDTERLRAFVAEWAGSAPELFPAGFDQGDRLHGFGRRSGKLPGLKLRKIVTADDSSYWLRPSFVTGYMTGTVDELAYPLLLAAHGVAPWLLTIGFGQSEMYWYRLIERLGQNSLVGTTIREAARLPEHLAADEHLNEKRYPEHWLHNLMTSTSLMGFRNPEPAIRESQQNRREVPLSRIA